jgi:hypothetical protein
MTEQTTKRTMFLPVELSAPEVLARAKHLSALVAEQREARERLDAHTKAAKSAKEGLEGEIEGLASRIAELATVVRNSREDREVEVYDSPDFVAGTMLTKRNDTGELVGSRGLTEAERQRNLFTAPEASAEQQA